MTKEYELIPTEAEEVLSMLNMAGAEDLASQLLSRLDRWETEGDEVLPRLTVEMPNGGAGRLIRSDKVDALSLVLLDLVANLVAQLIDAGSERDAVNENEDLLKAIQQELYGWSDHPTIVAEVMG